MYYTAEKVLELIEKDLYTLKDNTDSFNENYAVWDLRNISDKWETTMDKFDCIQSEYKDLIEVYYNRERGGSNLEDIKALLEEYFKYSEKRKGDYFYKGYDWAIRGRTDISLKDFMTLDIEEFTSPEIIVNKKTTVPDYDKSCIIEINNEIGSIIGRTTPLSVDDEYFNIDAYILNRAISGYKNFMMACSGYAMWLFIKFLFHKVSEYKFKEIIKNDITDKKIAIYFALTKQDAYFFLIDLLCKDNGFEYEDKYQIERLYCNFLKNGKIFGDLNIIGTNTIKFDSDFACVFKWINILQQEIKDIKKYIFNHIGITYKDI